MTTFAEKNVTYSDGQVNVVPLPEAIMANGFIPETRDAPGMPLAAQHLNWLFRDLYRNVNTVNDDALGKLDKEANLSDLANVTEALQNLRLGDIARLGTCTGSLAESGYIRIPIQEALMDRTLLIQWGWVSAPNGRVTVTYPIAFAERPYFISFGLFQLGYPEHMESQIIDINTYTNLGFVASQMMMNINSGVRGIGQNGSQWLAIGRI